MRHDILSPRPVYEYEVIPAPTRGDRRKGLRTDDERMAYALTEIFNELGAEGWEYVRTDTFTSASRADVTGTASRDHTLLVFRRAIAPLRPAAPVPAPTATPEPVAEPLLLTTPIQVDPAPATTDVGAPAADAVRVAVG